MTLSVLMSVYKSERPEYLDRSLQSIISDQTEKPDMVVLVQDGFLDNDLQRVINKWREIVGDKMVIIKNETNLGLTKSLNEGLDVITTDLVARMDSDDISCPERFEKQKRYLEQHPEIDILGGAILEIDEYGEPLNNRYYPRDNKSVYKSIYKANPLAHPTVMMRMRLFENGLRYNEKYKTNQDLALWFDAIIAGFNIGNLTDVILHFRRQSSVYRRRKKLKNLLREFKIYCHGIKKLYGPFSFKYVYPLSRLCLKLMPVFVVKWAYESHLRKVITDNSKNSK